MVLSGIEDDAHHHPSVKRAVEGCDHRPVGQDECSQVDRQLGAVDEGDVDPLEILGRRIMEFDASRAGGSTQRRDTDEEGPNHSRILHYRGFGA